MQNFRNPFFSNAPVGKIFADSALKLKPQILGPHQGDYPDGRDERDPARRAAQAVSPPQSWKQFLKDVNSVQAESPALAARPGREPRRPRPGLRRIRRSPMSAVTRHERSDRSGCRCAACAPRRRLLQRLDAKVSPYLYIAPFFLLFGVFGLFPLGYTAYISLTDRNLLSPVSHFIGLHNYALLIHDSYFWNAVENTFGIWFLSTVPQLAARARHRPRAEHEAAGAHRSSAWPSCCRR